jgi:signal transduction histidine kinase
LVCVGVALCAIAAVVTVTGSSTGRVWLEALARALSVAAPIAVGLYALRRPPFQRFGALLYLAGVVWFLTTLANADNAVLYSSGRVSAWLVEPLLVYLLLGFPVGRLEGRIDRALVAATAFLVLTLYLPTSLLVERYVVPGPWMSCESECPDNAFMLAHTQPAFVDDVMRPLREVLTVLVMLAVAARLAQRLHRSTRLTRRVIAPVLTVAALRCGVYGSAVLIRRLAPDSTLADAWLWLLAFMLPLTALAFLVGLTQWWVFIGRSTRRLAAGLVGNPGPEDLREALAEAFDDPTLEVVYPLQDGGWVDAAGIPRTVPIATGKRSATEVRDGDRVIAMIVHDRALCEDRGFVEAATAFTAMTLAHHACLQSAAADERLRIQRDLHDGAQQRLIALAINLGLGAEQAGQVDGEHAAALMRRLAEEVDRTLEELRALTDGTDPPRLVDRGLVVALQDAAVRNPVPTTVLAARTRRLPLEVERALYFCGLEAMQNTAKHADGATAVIIEVSDSPGLRMEVRDDGVGFDSHHITLGLGLRNMHARLSAVGGELAIVSSVGHGTRIIATIPPMAAAVRAPSGRGRAT